MATGITVTTFVRLPRTMVHGSVRFLITLFLDWRWWLSMLITAHAHPEGPFHPERFALRWRREGLSATIQGWLTWAFLGYTFGLFAVRIYRGLRAGAEAVRELRSRRPRAEPAEAQAQVIPTPLHVLGRISPIFSPFFPVFCAFSPSRRGGSNEPQAGAQDQQETVAMAPKHRFGGPANSGCWERMASSPAWRKPARSRPGGGC